MGYMDGRPWINHPLRLNTALAVKTVEATMAQMPLVPLMLEAGSYFGTIALTHEGTRRTARQEMKRMFGYGAAIKKIDEVQARRAEAQAKRQEEDDRREARIAAMTPGTAMLTAKRLEALAHPVDLGLDDELFWMAEMRWCIAALRAWANGDPIPEPTYDQDEMTTVDMCHEVRGYTLKYTGGVRGLDKANTEAIITLIQRSEEKRGVTSIS